MVELVVPVAPTDTDVEIVDEDDVTADRNDVEAIKDKDGDDEGDPGSQMD
jgi:hypothetical protein